MSNLDDEILGYDSMIWGVIHKYYPTFAKNEDVFQEGRIAVWTALENYNETLNVPKEAYLRLMIRWRISNFLRTIIKTDKEDLFPFGSDFDEEEDGSSLNIFGPDNRYFDLDEIVERKMLAEEIRKEMDHSLTENERRVVLYRADGLTFSQISKIMGSSKQNVSEMFHKGRNKLIKKFGGRYYE